MLRALLYGTLRETYAFVIYDLNDHSQSTSELAMGKEYNAANLNKPPLRGGNLDLCHLSCICT